MHTDITTTIDPIAGTIVFWQDDVKIVLSLITTNTAYVARYEGSEDNVVDGQLVLMGDGAGRTWRVFNGALDGDALPACVYDHLWRYAHGIIADGPDF